MDKEQVIYVPEGGKELAAIPGTLGVKFCQDTFFLESFMKQFNIEYKESDLEDTPFGRGIRIKKDKKQKEEPNVLA